jgi:hypothetical protein
MASYKHASKRSAQSLTISSNNTPMKSAKSKSIKQNDTPNMIVQEERENNTQLDEIHELLKVMARKLDKLDIIEEKVKSAEEEMKGLKQSLEYAYAEIGDLKRQQELSKICDEETKKRIKSLENENTALHDSIVDLKARSMRDNLVFYNISEQEKEDTTAIIHSLLEDKFEVRDATNMIKIDRSHRIGRKVQTNAKPRPIVVKFNYFQDREYIRKNARKLKGTRIPNNSRRKLKELEKHSIQNIRRQKQKRKGQGWSGTNLLLKVLFLI